VNQSLEEIWAPVPSAPVAPAVDGQACDEAAQSDAARAPYRSHIASVVRFALLFGAILWACEAHLALTPSTLQFGARIDLFARKRRVELEGFVAFSRH
jgi:hypothetical protein